VRIVRLAVEVFLCLAAIASSRGGAILFLGEKMSEFFGREMGGVPLWAWMAFNAFVLAMLALDLGVFHRKSHVVKGREALIWSGVWIGLALVFNVIVWAWRGPQAGTEFLTGYLIEKALSVDNIFVFLLIFAFFKVPPAYQHRVLFWGIIGALVMRAICIAVGAALLKEFHWLVYVFGAILIASGIKMVTSHGKEIDPEKNPILKLFRRMVPVTPDYVGDKFFVIREGKRWATPLFVALLFVEISDLIFAVDSIPAILAITQDTFIVYTSNVFAILGLRALFFALADVMGRFRFLHFALSAILIFVGTKMLVSEIYGKIPVGISLGVVVSLLVGAIAASMFYDAGFRAGQSTPQLKADDVDSNADGDDLDVDDLDGNHFDGDEENAGEARRELASVR
jgi:tellurite resistance protein TerC